MLSPSERVLRSQIAAHTSWANTPDRAARTLPARRAMLDKFERQVDPDGVLAPAERAARAQHAKKAHYARLALLSAQARRRRAALIAPEEGTPSDGVVVQLGTRTGTRANGHAGEAA